MCFLLFSEETAVSALNGINQLVFVTDTQRVFFQVGKQTASSGNN
jgi:hypothetical protein